MSEILYQKMSELQYDKTLENIIYTKQNLKQLLKMLDKISNDLIAYNHKSGTQDLCYGIGDFMRKTDTILERLNKNYNHYFINE